MSKSEHELLMELRAALTNRQYSPVVISNYCTYAHEFLDYLVCHGIPLWPETVILLEKLLARQPRAPDQRLFVNRYGEPLSASGVRFKLAAYVKTAAETMPSCKQST